MNFQPGDGEPGLSPLKQALLAIERLQGRLAAAERSRREPIAIVGVGCRFPGGADDVDAYWELLRAGRNTRREVPRERWDIDAYFDPDPAAPGKVATRYGSFLDGVDGFDAAFFGVSPREAERIDPQHRLLLEVAWEALEDAGIAPGSLAGSRTGVFMGIMSAEYGKLLLDGDLAAADVYYATGNELSFAPGRISYALGLRGPCAAIDTACSSSLVAVHQACQSLRAGECELALAGGVSLVITPELSVALSKAHVMSADGLCKTFDAAADGIGRGEGAGVVALRRLSDAVARGDRILAVIRGSAVNHDGASGGLTVPSGPAQEALLRAALSDAGVAPHAVGYVEAHGTGTELGDLIEARAIAAVLGAGRPAERPLWLGSAKTNFGHLDSAAGIAGLIRAALVVARRELPPHPHLRVKSPHVPWDSCHMDVATTRTPWAGADGSRIAGVSAFGLSGINAHVVLGEAPPAPARESSGDGPLLLTLSARDGAALRALAGAYQGHLARETDAGARAIAATAALRRDHHEHRVTVVGDTPAALAGGLAAFVAGHEHAGVRAGRARAGGRRVVFVFPGQGSQWIGMGRELLTHAPAFRAALEQVEAALCEFVDWSPLAVLRGEEGAPALERLDVVQPVLFALQVALAAQWQAWGVTPAAVVGHSMGEVAAACVAGALSLADGARIICRRSQLARRLCGRGAMAVVELGVEAARAAIAGLEDRVAIAVCNAPRSTVLAGEPAALDEVLARLTAREVFCRRVKVDFASHSPQTDPLREELLVALAPVRPRAAALPMVSTVTRARLRGDELDAMYWARNLREPVLFGPVIADLRAQGFDTFVEISPHPILLPFIAASEGEGPPPTALASLRREHGERAALLDSLGALLVGGGAADLSRVFDRACPPVQLPRYPWQRRRCWLPARAPRARRGGHPIAGVRYASSLAGAQFWDGVVAADAPEYLGDHRVQGAVVLPGAAQIEAMLAAATGALGDGPWVLADVAFPAALVLPEGQARTIQLALQRDGDGAAVQLAAEDTGAWTVTCTARVRPGEARRESGREELAAARRRCDRERSPAAFYAGLAGLGLNYGPAFRGVQALWCGPGEALAEVRGPARGEYQIHPALLDAAMHTLMAALPEDLLAGGPALPVAVERVQLFMRPGDAVISHVSLRPGASAAGASADVRLWSVDGEPVAALLGVRVQRLDVAAVRPGEELLVATWQPAARPQRARTGRRWLLVDLAGTGEALASALARRGEVVDREGEIGEHSDVVLLAPEVCRTTPLPDCERGYAAALRLAQTAVERPAPPRLWLVTSDGLAAALIAGLARTIVYEHPELRCARIEAADVAVDAIVDELLADADDDEVRLDASGRQVARLVPRAPGPVTRPFAARPDGAYLITGGLGGLGLAAARWLVGAGARHIVLVGRTGAATPAQADAVAALRARGAEVTVARADVADIAAVEHVLADIRSRGLALRGVLHAAGVLADGVLPTQDLPRLREVLAPKAAGAWNLHVATRGLELDCFVLYSSASSLLGAPGQANYAAANAFVDALARLRRAQGLPALAVQWGAFAEVGLAAQEGRGETLQARGAGLLAPDDSGPALARLLAADEAVVGVVPLDVPRWVAAHPHVARSSLLRGLVEEPGTNGDEPLRGALAAADAPARAGLVEAFLRAQVAQVLRAEPASVDRDASLKRHGVDSLMAIELKNRVHARLGVRLPVLSFLQGASLAALAGDITARWTAEHLVAAVRGAETGAAADEWEVTSL
jgi:myxalamid-type polyketide synthase MxaE and MxaD